MPGAARAPTRNLGSTLGGPTLGGRPPEAGGPITPPTARPMPAPAPAAPSFMSALDPTAPDPTGDWAKAIGQLMQNKASITKIVIELGDKSRIVFKKG